MRRIADPAAALAVACFPINDARIVGTQAGIADQGHAIPQTDQSLDISLADIVLDYPRAVTGYREVGNQQVVDVGTRIVLADQEGLAPEIVPAYDFLRSKRMIRRQGDEYPLAP